MAAVTLPSLVTGPLLGAWLDLTGRRRRLMVIDQLAISASLVGILALAGNAPAALVPCAALVAGLTYPLSFGGFTSFIPVLVPDELLTPANALEASSFNLALIVGPALAGTLAAVFSPEASLVVEIVLSLAALVLILAIPGLDRGGRERGDGSSLLSIAREGLVHIVAVPQLRGITVAGALGLGGLGLLTVAFPFFCVDHLGAERSAAGYLWAAFAFGSMLGALLLVRLQHRFRVGVDRGGGHCHLRRPDAAVADPGEPSADARAWWRSPAWPTAPAWPPPSPRASASCRRELHAQVFTTAAGHQGGRLLRRLGAGGAGGAGGGLGGRAAGGRGGAVPRGRAGLAAHAVAPARRA